MKNLLIVFTFIFTLFFISESFALPRFSIKQKDKCIDCHYNPTGGIIRNEDAWHWGKNTLSMFSLPDKEFIMSPRITENISIGLDYRTQYLYSQEKKRTDFQEMSGAIYTNFGLSKNINLTAKYDFVWALWEGYGTAHILPNNGYIKAGSFIPNYGLRIDDHTAFTRGGDFGLLSSQLNTGLIYNPFYSEAGVEAGIYISDFAFFTASAGSNLLHNRTLSKDPTYTTRLEITPQLGKIGLLFGGSFAAAKVPLPVEMYGGFFGFGFDEFSLLAEFDQAKNIYGTDVKSNMLMVEAAYGLITGLDAVVRLDWITPNTDFSDIDIKRFVFGFEFHPYSFIEVRPQYRLVLEDPSIDNDSFVLQFHFWY